MRLRLIAVGRARRGPEADLVRDYLDRFAKQGRGVGLPPVELVEIDDRKSGGMEVQADLIARAIPDHAALVVMDERGQQLTSPEFADRLGGWRDRACDVALVIGGADGIAPELRGRADLAISYGRAVWPHMLVRVMLSEQLYRAATILSGSPYHRE